MLRNGFLLILTLLFLVAVSQTASAQLFGGAYAGSLVVAQAHTGTV